ncbi:MULTISPECIES: D-alanyl-D-alanine endopeptidase [Aeromonas]|jgi:D-alanyl-D-alanine endopeptidase (penicillin-binding protein 7)|uniref:D-alanyl-D-alanine endopeptidase n=1 Tax=Aeromonas rivipollensis TaxID=948519 RepID=A0AAW9Y9W4_9GAMM|nr:MULTISPECIES: D-alanyl-D-alanine endopeptidase [Aeromonas]QIY88671.1 D-alanyl-D-alanine endopeptidase [Aeromonas hydrophila]HCH53629.1 D-alanyl-D-alanine endopeptidase [Aeromonas sp.]AVP92048.1 D-alanyl-D-alanine endopeptidase [Aeromonas rivipollensis]MBS4701231.1 D-alanyl-D-alanine endopeptidase [Aeromonas media]MCE9923969.1 D-alanyl-D-alanine endopeptidase [Aeromonas media]
MGCRIRAIALVCGLIGLLGSQAALAAPNPAKLQIKSGSALVMDINTGKTLYQKNPAQVRPIASLTKLMTALVVLDARQNLNQTLTIDQNDRDNIKHTYSRVRFGTKVSRRDALHLALMSSENRMASALARHYPGGRSAFIRAMNNKARQLGMRNSRFYDSTGLSTRNVSTARDLAKLITAAYRQPLIRQFTQDTNKEMRFSTPAYSLMFNNTNPLVKNPDWDVRLSKTGYTDEAGRCLLMRAKPDRQELAIVLLNSVGKRTPIGDANRIRKWLKS